MESLKWDPAGYYGNSRGNFRRKTSLGIHGMPWSAIERSHGIAGGPIGCHSFIAIEGCLDTYMAKWEPLEKQNFATKPVRSKSRAYKPEIMQHVSTSRGYSRGFEGFEAGNLDNMRVPMNVRQDPRESVGSRLKPLELPRVPALSPESSRACLRGVPTSYQEPPP